MVEEVVVKKQELLSDPDDIIDEEDRLNFFAA